MKITTAAIICILLSIFTLGQTNSAPTTGTDRLSFFIGKWKWEAKGLTTYGDPKRYKGIGYSNIYYVNESKSILDDHTINYENGVKYRAITFRTYDPKKKTYLVVWAQTDSSNTTKIEGHWEGDKFIEIEKGTDKFGTWTNRMEIFDILPNSRRAKLVRTYKSGFTMVMLEYKATRVK